MFFLIRIDVVAAHLTNGDFHFGPATLEAEIGIGEIISGAGLGLAVMCSITTFP